MHTGSFNWHVEYLYHLRKLNPNSSLVTLRSKGLWKKTFICFKGKLYGEHMWIKVFRPYGFSPGFQSRLTQFKWMKRIPLHRNKSKSCSITSSFPCQQSLSTSCALDKLLLEMTFHSKFRALWILGTFNTNYAFGNILRHMPPQSRDELSITGNWGQLWDIAL